LNQKRWKVDQRLKKLGRERSFQLKLWPCGWALGQVTWVKMIPKLLHLWRHS